MSYDNCHRRIFMFSFVFLCLVMFCHVFLSLLRSFYVLSYLLITTNWFLKILCRFPPRRDQHCKYIVEMERIRGEVPTQYGMWTRQGDDNPRFWRSGRREAACWRKSELGVFSSEQMRVNWTNESECEFCNSSWLTNWLRKDPPTRWRPPVLKKWMKMVKTEAACWRKSEPGVLSNEKWEWMWIL